MPAWMSRIVRVARSLLLVGIVLVVGVVSAYLATKLPAKTTVPSAAPAGAVEAEKLQRIDRNAILIPESMARNIDLKTVAVAGRSRPMPFPPLQGTLAIDNSRLSRVHSRFAGEVMTLGLKTVEAERSITSQAAPTVTRPLAVGDAVRKGDLLAVVWSKDLGEKKSELIDAVSRLRADDLTYRRLETAYKDGTVPERSFRDVERIVEADRIAVERAERTLRTWRLTEHEIAGVRQEGERVSAKPGDKRPDGGEWARVEVRAPQDGMILEKNVAAGDIVDTTADLFKVGDLSQLVVWAHVFEEDLPALETLPKPARWVVKLPSRPGTSFAGQLGKVGAVIDPNQHTALVTGHVDNPTGDLKVGQFVTASLELPAPKDEIELPAEAVVEDGRQSVVFVKAKDKAGCYHCVSVQVASRTREVVCVRAGAGVQAGDEIITNGAVLLRDAMDVLPVPDEKTPRTP